MDTAIKTKAKARKTLHKKSVRIRLDPKIHQQADQLAKAEKCSFSQLVESVLERYFQSIRQDDGQLVEQSFRHTQHGVWSQIGADEAAANLQAALLQERQS